MATASLSLDLSNLPALLAALGNGLELAFITSDGNTWTAALVQTGQPAYVYSGTDVTPGAALTALVQEISDQVVGDATIASTKATAVAASVKPSAVQPGGTIKGAT